MAKLDVRMIELEPLHVASTLGFGESPEGLAWEKLTAWARAQGLLERTPRARFFGFNNPSPSAGSPNYGYEAWMIVGPEVQASGDVRIKDFAGGLYAVAHCDFASLVETWRRLVAWREASPYTPANHQWLEEHLFVPARGVEQDAEFDLYMPVRR